MVFEKNIVSNLKIYLWVFFALWSIIYLMVAVSELDIIWPMLCTVMAFALFNVLLKKKIRVQQVEDAVLVIEISHTFLFPESIYGHPLRNIYCIYMYRRSGVGSLSSAKTGSAQMVRSAVNILQIINTKDDVIFETELWDDKESYNVAYWLQSILNVEIHDYMGRELEIIAID